jgi:sugar phosphate isomerase/epimerase
LALAHLTVLELSPPLVVETAAAAGFRLVGLRLAPAAPGERVFPMLPTASGLSPMMRDTLARMHDLDVAVNDVELVGLREDSDVLAFEGLFEAAARLSARHVFVAGDGADESAMADRLAALCEVARRHGLRMGLEFMPLGSNQIRPCVRLPPAPGTRCDYRWVTSRAAEAWSPMPRRAYCTASTTDRSAASTRSATTCSR